MDRRMYCCLAKDAEYESISIQCCGMTPLGIAAFRGNLKAVKSLLGSEYSCSIQQEVNENFALSQRPSTLDFNTEKAKSENNGYFVIYRDVEENELEEGPTPEGMEALEWDMEVNDSDGKCNVPTPPDAQIYKYYADVLNRTAISTLPSPENDIARLDYHGMNALHHAIQQDHYDIVEYLVMKYSKHFSVNQSNAKSFSPLQIAVQGRNPAMVKLLLKLGACIDYTNSQRETALHFAACNGDIEIVHSLIDANADLNVRNTFGYTPLSFAVDGEHEDVVTCLIKVGTKLNLEDAAGRTELFRAVEINNVAIAKALIQGGAKIVHSHFLLHEAIVNNNFEMMRVLHGAGALLTNRDSYGNTPLIIACKQKNYLIAKYLLENGVPVDKANELTELTPLAMCVKTMHSAEVFTQFLDLLLSYNTDIDAMNTIGTVLTNAIVLHNNHAAGVLIKYGADVNKRTRTANLCLDNLQIAVRRQSWELVKLLVCAGFDVRSQLAGLKCCEGSDEILEFLTLVGMNPMSLKDLCRIKIRRTVAKGLVFSIRELPLPQLLIRYLMLEEL